MSSRYNCILHWIIFVIVFISTLTSCKVSTSSNNNSEIGHISDSSKNDSRITNEYLIILIEGADISNAIQELTGYEILVINDLAKGRYLIEIKNDPGLAKLQDLTINSQSIRFIQPNYKYKKQ